MQAVELLRIQANQGFEEMWAALEGVTEPRAWAVLPNLGPDYLHTDGSIHGVTLHVATCKVIYGSVAFRGTEVRWRDLADRVEQFEPSWEAALAYLPEAHAYWMRTWEGLDDRELELDVPRFNGDLWPAWKIIQTVIHHDFYHAGQIAVLRYGVVESAEPPPSVAADIRQYCADSPSW